MIISAEHHCRRFAFALAGIAVMIAAPADGQTPLAINNPGFEVNTVSEGCFQVFSELSGWDNYDPNMLLDGGNNSVGGLNLPPGSIFFPAGAPEGDHVALTFLLTTTGLGPVGFRQTLGDTLQPNTIYTLTAQIGDIDSGTGPPPCDIFGEFNLEGFPGYQVQLFAGNLMIGQDDNTLAGVLDDGLFELSTTRVCIGADHPRLNQSLEIRLINLNLADTPENPGIEVDFDDVQLTAEPNTMPLIGDVDTDCDVDLDDYNQFAACVGGPNQPLPGECSVDIIVDFDDDADVDLADVALFQLDFANSN